MEPLSCIVEDRTLSTTKRMWQKCPHVLKVRAERPSCISGSAESICQYVDCPLPPTPPRWPRSKETLASTPREIPRKTLSPPAPNPNLQPDLPTYLTSKRVDGTKMRETLKWGLLLKATYSWGLKQKGRRNMCHVWPCTHALEEQHVTSRRFQLPTESAFECYSMLLALPYFSTSANVTLNRLLVEQ